MRNLPIAKLASVQPRTLTVTYGDERVTLDPARPWAEFQVAKLKVEALLEQAMQAHDKANIDGEEFESASNVYGERAG